MTLNDFFQLSVSVFCIVSIVSMIIFFVWAAMLRTQLNRLIARLEEILGVIKETAGSTKVFIEKTIDSLETLKKSLFTLGFVKTVVTNVIGLIKNHSKGSENGQND